VEVEVCYPGEEVFFFACLFAALKGVEALFSAHIVGVPKVFDPCEVLLADIFASFAEKFFAVIRAQFEQGLVFQPCRRQGTFLEDNEVFPAIFSAYLHCRPVGIQGVHAQT